MAKKNTHRRQQTTSTLRKAFQLVASSGYELAAGLREDSLNDFLVSHWKTETSSSSSVYRGGGRLDDLELSYEYAVAAPGQLDLAPLTDAQFQKLYASWVATIPELSRFLGSPEGLPKEVQKLGSIADQPPPNVRVTIPKLKLMIKTDSGPQVTLDIGIRATAYIAVYKESGRHVVKITPIDVRLVDARSVAKAVDEALARLGIECRDNGDCIALKKVIFHIANVVLAKQIGSFITKLELPLPIDLFDGVAINNADLEIVDDLMVVLANIAVVSAAPSPARAGLVETNDPEELRRFAERELQSAEADFKSGPGNDRKAAGVENLTANTRYPNRGVFLWLHQRLFQLLADKLLVMEDGKEHCDTWFIFKFCYGWFMKTWAPVAKILGNSLDVDLGFQGGAWAKACITTHCGDLCHTISATATAKPKARVETTFYFDNNELWMSSKPQPFFVDWEVGGLPWPFNKFIEFFLEVLTNLTLVFIVALGKRWKRKLTTLPSYFPGTSLTYTAAFDQYIVKDPDDSALMALGEVDFKP